VSEAAALQQGKGVRSSLAPKVQANPRLSDSNRPATAMPSHPRPICPARRRDIAATAWITWQDGTVVDQGASLDVADVEFDAEGATLRGWLYRPRSLVAAHQGGAMVTYATGSPEPLRAAVNAAVDYVRSFAPAPGQRRSRSTSGHKSKSRPR
jgi:hypothetical protein